MSFFPFQELSFFWIMPLVVWTSIWKGLGLWHAAKNNQRYWFISLLLINTMGILEIIYLKFFQKKRVSGKTHHQSK